MKEKEKMATVLEKVEDETSEPIQEITEFLLDEATKIVEFGIETTGLSDKEFLAVVVKNTVIF